MSAPSGGNPNAPAVLRRPGPSLLVRVVWFLVVGWWLGGVASAVAWALNATVVGLPVGLWIINRLPTLITLRPQQADLLVVDGALVPAVAQRPFIVRAVWFLLVGWWLSGLWMGAAYALVLSVVGMPLAFWMYGRIGAVTTLFRS